MALNLAETKLMLVRREKTVRCKTEALTTCKSVSPIYMVDNYRLYEHKLFMVVKDGIKNDCQVEALTNTVLPQAIIVIDGVWAVTTQREMRISKVYNGKSTKTIKIICSLSRTKLPLGCSAFRIYISLTPYYEAEEKFEEKKTFIQVIKGNSSS